MNALQFAADSFHTKKLCSRLSSRKVRFYSKNGRYAVFCAPFGRLRGQTYDVHLRLTGKCIVHVSGVSVSVFDVGIGIRYFCRYFLTSVRYSVSVL